MNRLDALDGARFLAYCGMVLVNFRIAAQVPPGQDWASLLIDSLEGRASSLFVILAGIGIGISYITASLLLRRAGFLFAIGLINTTVFDADILHFYALYFVVGAAFLSASSRILWAAAVGVVALAGVAYAAFDYDAGWDWHSLTYPDLWTLPGFLRNALFNGWHPVLPWAAFLLIGMAIGQSQLQTRCVQHRLIMWGFAAMVAAWVPQRLITNPELHAYMGTESIPPGPFYILSGTGSACLMIGLLLKIWPILERARISPCLVVPGRQSLTLYIAHILIGMGLLEALGLLNGSLLAPQIVTFAGLFCGVSSLYALLWARRFKRGPLEALMRKVTDPRKP